MKCKYNIVSMKVIQTVVKSTCSSQCTMPICRLYIKCDWHD